MHVFVIWILSRCFFVHRATQDVRITLEKRGIKREKQNPQVGTSEFGRPRPVPSRSSTQSTTERTTHVHPVTKTVAMRANSLDVISLPTFFCAKYKIVAGKTKERMEQHTPPT